VQDALADFPISETAMSSRPDPRQGCLPSGDTDRGSTGVQPVHVNAEAPPPSPAETCHELVMIFGVRTRSLTRFGRARSRVGLSTFPHDAAVELVITSSGYGKPNRRLVLPIACPEPRLALDGID
jgi:hypothetical protein